MDRSEINPFLKNKPTNIEIHNRAMEKFKFHPLGQDKAILKCVLNTRYDMDKTRFMSKKRHNELSICIIL